MDKLTDEHLDALATHGNAGSYVDGSGGYMAVVLRVARVGRDGHG